MRLLIIEDDPRLLKVLEKALKEAGYAIDTAADGTEGLYKSLNQTYDAIVLDVMLPGIDGWEILRQVRKKHSTPILMLTARDATEDLVRGLDEGADDYLIKPFDLAELFARLRVIIRRGAGRIHSVIQIDDVIIDSRSRNASHGGAPARLTPREFAILEYLAMKRGKLITRTELFDHLFDENEDTLSNVLDVHIHAIRRKIRPDLIVTRRGEGYIIP
jgi:two-component system OmpR family response regulator